MPRGRSVQRGDVLQQAEPQQTPQLIRDVLAEARRLARIEIALAREDLKEQIKRTKAAGIALGSASALALSGLTLLLATVGLAFSKAWLAMLILGGAVVVIAGVIAYAAWRSVPKTPFGQTKGRLQSDLSLLGGRKP